MAGFSLKTIFPCSSLFSPWWHWYQKMWNFLSHLLIHVKSLSDDVHLFKRPRKCLKSIFNHFPGNWLKFGIILNDFPSFSISEFNLPIPGTDFKQTCVNLLRGYHEMPQKACERCFFTWEHFHNFLKCPKIEEFNFRFLFGLKIGHVLIFRKFMLTPHFSYFILKMGKNRAFQKNRT